jgi:hypothetical protein
MAVRMMRRTMMMRRRQTRKSERGKLTIKMKMIKSRLMEKTKKLRMRK